MKKLVIKATENIIAWGKIEFARRCISDFMFSNKWMQYDENIVVKNDDNNVFTTFIFIDEDTEQEVYCFNIETMESIIEADSFIEVYNIVYDIMNKLMSDYFRGLNKKD
jgi:hypothetical protein